MMTYTMPEIKIDHATGCHRFAAGPAGRAD
jgi:hypothetical protein